MLTFLKIQIIWVVITCGLVNSYDVSED